MQGRNIEKELFFNGLFIVYYEFAPDTDLKGQITPKSKIHILPLPVVFFIHVDSSHVSCQVLDIMAQRCQLA